MGDKTCVAFFEFVTNEACTKPSAVPEIPCSLYGDDNKLRDLTPLIKLKGTVYKSCVKKAPSTKCSCMSCATLHMYKFN